MFSCPNWNEIERSAFRVEKGLGFTVDVLNWWYFWDFQVVSFDLNRALIDPLVHFWNHKHDTYLDYEPDKGTVFPAEYRNQEGMKSFFLPKVDGTGQDC